ncbi:glycosyltransferase family 2 protein [Candidatus Roizmanbacteria bacterium CG10_big_fil_rev_8_21_14_0_10_45_7]|uniref:Glycosyltransferase family 2 protein n=1 Tax=Candidatus Roizmanbacteria bacterium CG10_big_fil_rev_8_21_14_0_10_45_7 TaxID=1974854 RepID=A0A2M8KUN3_9BACT|nr:MAG: glycosyltransferase family 2 protein [Candidatus Roizmanbacteria bacterium CG10_big_fil_rev_8_21_14_0_10_45_7]
MTFFTNDFLTLQLGKVEHTKYNITLYNVQVPALMSSQALIALPAYNEEKVLGCVLQSLRHAGYTHIVVVDDGSTDATARIARNYRVHIISFPRNKGKGSALRAAISYAIKKRYKALVTMDADGQHNPLDIASLLNGLQTHDVALGNRFARHAYIPVYARAANMLGNIVNAVFTGTWVSDSQCGLRAYTRAALVKLRLHSTHYEIDTEIIRELKRKHISYTQIPVRVRYTAYSKSKRTKQSFLMGLETIARLVTIYKK